MHDYTRPENVDTIQEVAECTSYLTAAQIGHMSSKWCENSPPMAEGTNKTFENAMDIITSGPGHYLVMFSYDTPIGIIDHDFNKAVFTTEKFSSSTSRHLNAFKKCMSDRGMTIEEV